MHGTHQGLPFIRAALVFTAAAYPHHSALLIFAQVFPVGAVHTLKKHLDSAIRQAQHLKNLAHNAHGGKIGGFGFFQFRFALGYQKNLFAVAGLCGFYGLDRGFASHKERHDGTRKHDHLAQRHDGQIHVFNSAAFGFSHSFPLKDQMEPL